MNHSNMAHVQGYIDLHYWFYCYEVSIQQLFLHYKYHLNDLILNFYLRNLVLICHICILVNSLYFLNLKINFVLCPVSTNYVIQFVNFTRRRCQVALYVFLCLYPEKSWFKYDLQCLKCAFLLCEHLSVHRYHSDQNIILHHCADRLVWSRRPRTLGFAHLGCYEGG